MTRWGPCVSGRFTSNRLFESGDCWRALWHIHVMLSHLVLQTSICWSLCEALGLCPNHSDPFWWWFLGIPRSDKFSFSSTLLLELKALFSSFVQRDKICLRVGPSPEKCANISGSFPITTEAFYEKRGCVSAACVTLRAFGLILWMRVKE